MFATAADLFILETTASAWEEFKALVFIEDKTSSAVESLKTKPRASLI
jgi:hypothetical protein